MARQWPGHLRGIVRTVGRRMAGGRSSQEKTLGQRGELAASRYLRRKGYKIVAHGERWRKGELDLIAVDHRTIVFVEVKTRRSHALGHPAEAVDLVKQSRLTRAAVTFLKGHGLLEYAARFDVIAITWPKGVRRPTIEHLENAFEAVGQGSMFG